MNPASAPVPARREAARDRPHAAGAVNPAAVPVPARPVDDRSAVSTTGVATPEGTLTPVERRVLAALSRRPLGLYPVESVALAADAGAQETARSLARLADLGLVERNEETVPSRPVRRELVWKLTIEAWRQVPDVLRRTAVPEVVTGPMPERLPARFAHLFWWGDTSLYHLPRDAAFVAEQILTSDDVTSWGWALFTLPVGALGRVAERPHLPADRRGLILDTLAQRGVARPDDFWLGPPHVVDGLNVGSLQDITAGKYNAIATRKQLRDFVDVMRPESTLQRNRRCPAPITGSSDLSGEWVSLMQPARIQGTLAAR